MVDEFRYIINAWEEYLKSQKPEEYVALYVHIPFCTSRCNYCIYSSVPYVSAEAVDDYLKSLLREMSLFAPLFKGTKIGALYIGGGSPSLLTVPQMDYLFDTIQSQFELDVCNDHMFAFEIAPHHIDTDKVDFIASSFINRVSVGVQSFNRGVQRAENRPNPSKEYITFILGYLMASLKDKLSRINVDLMIGLDGQDVRSLKADLKTLTGIGVPRITVYANRKPRPEEERVRFEQYVVSSLLHLEQFFPTYDLITNRGGYQVPNWFIRKGFRNYFKKFYRTLPYLNSNLAFGYKAHSFISPRMFWYHKEADGYLIDHDSSRGICRSDVFRSRFEEGRRVVENKVDISYYAF